MQRHDYKSRPPCAITREYYRHVLSLWLDGDLVDIVTVGASRRRLSLVAWDDRPVPLSPEPIPTVAAIRVAPEGATP